MQDITRSKMKNIGDYMGFPVIVRNGRDIVIDLRDKSGVVDLRKCGFSISNRN